MLISKKKWEDGFVSEKLDFVKSIFYVANVDSDCVSKGDLIIMCEFLLRYTQDLKDINNELHNVITELKSQPNKTTCNPTEG